MGHSFVSGRKRVKIALISFEYPPAVAIGGIGTYAWQASHMLAAHGIEVAVFAAGLSDNVESPHPLIRVQRIVAENRIQFSSCLIPFLFASHQRDPIDVIEAPEIGPEGAPAFRALPQVARVVKLHTPAYLVDRVGYEHPGFARRFRFWIGGLRRGCWRRLSRPVYQRESDAEYHGALLADEIAAPSCAIGEVVARDWRLNDALIHHYPLPFEPRAELLALPPPHAVSTVGFLGRLEPRKGVLELARAIPAILDRFPHLRFRLIGPSWPYHDTDMQSWIGRHFPRIMPALDFTGAITPAQVPRELERCDILVLPSRWESFGFTCCESLSSGRAVIGSASGGMADMIEPGISGLLVPPNSPRAIADAVISLAADPAKTVSYGLAGRTRITTLLAPARVLPLQLASYQRAIRQAAIRNSHRPSNIR